MDDSISCKKCPACKQIKLSSEFHSDKSRRDGLQSRCKQCCKEALKRPKPIHIPVPDGLKRCPQCGENKPATTEYFHSHKTTRDGLNGWCKPCSSKKNRERKPRIDPTRTHQKCNICGNTYPATPEYFSRQHNGVNGIRPMCNHCTRKASLQWRNDHLERARTNSRLWYKANKERASIYNKQYYQAHREHCKERWTQYHQTHKEEIINRQRAFYTAHRDQLIEKTRERRKTHFYHSDTKEYRQNYYRSHRAYYIAKAHKRMALMQSIPGTYTAQEAREQYIRQRGKCYYCRRKVKWGKHHLDHTFPVSRQYARNSIDHIVVTCHSCNLRKSNKYPWEFPEGNRLL